LKYAKNQAKLLGATSKLLATLAQTAPGTAQLQAGIEALIDLIQVKYGLISMLDEQGNLTQLVYAGISAEEAGRTMHSPGGDGLLGVVIPKNVVLRLDNAADETGNQGLQPIRSQMTSLLAVPISNHDRVYGRIYLCDKFDNIAFSDEDEELVLSFANSISLILDNAGKMNKLEQEQSYLIHTACHDPLTRLPNRVLLGDRIGQALGHANRSQTQVAILFCDLDDFKVINDTVGHQAGDHVLKIMGERFENCMRRNDTVARVGGDEFVFVLSEVESIEQIEIVSRKILDAISQRISIDGHELMLYGSIGIAIYPLDGNETEGLVKNADIAMYQAKRRGNNNYQFFEEGFLVERAWQSGLYEHN
jgi:diguanylate cyclase (GGDEF)-like protein